MLTMTKTDGPAILYLDLYDKYTKKYQHVALLMQVGVFWEIYSSADGKRGNAKDIALCLNIALKLKADNKTLMAGIPLAAFNKYAPLLLQSGYTIVCFEQQVQEDKIIRHPTRIISPGTDFDTQKIYNWLTSFYIEFYNDKSLSIGMAVTDRTVSDTVIVSEIHSTKTDPDLAVDTIVAFIEQYPPTECIITSQNPTKAQKLVTKLFNQHQQPLVHTIQWDPTQVSGTITEHSTYVHIALYQLQQFLSEHFLTLENPVVEYYTSSKYLELSSTATVQLDIPLLIKTLDYTKTVMGQRLLTQRLLQPLRCKHDIEKSHDMIQSLSTKTCKNLRQFLHGIPDMQRLQQRMQLQKLTLQQFGQCHQTYQTVVNHLHSCIEFSNKSDLSNMIQWYKSVFLESAFEKDDMDSRIFVTGHNNELDEIYDKLQKAQQQLTKFSDDLNRVLEKYNKSGGTVKLNCVQQGFETTTIRANIIQQHKPNFTYIKQKSSTIITCDEIQSSIQLVQEHSNTVELLQQLLFQEFQKQCFEKYRLLLLSVESYIADLDFWSCGRYIADTFCYCKPVITNKRKLDGKQIRHPIIERIHDHQQYIPNDILLSEDTYTGWVLYGMNAGGKTSILKAIGLSVVMAQAGLFVAAESFEFSLFHRIMTRIAGTDNMVRGQSSFQVEMEELRSVVHRADTYTLLLGDEVCRGTEVQSANAIVYTLLQFLHERKIFFMTATHLHELSEYMKNSLPNIKICHTKVEVRGNGDIIYHRILQDGPGPELYGLEVARALDFPKEFIDKAIAFRKTRSPQTARYNRRKVVKNCQVCGYKPTKQRDLPLDTHHINFQCNADEKGFHGANYKHALHNLIVLCKECHVKVHQKVLSIVVEQTAKGSQITVTES